MRPLLLAIVATFTTRAQAAGEPAMRLAVVQKIVAPKQEAASTSDRSVARLDRAEEVTKTFEVTLSSLGVESFTRAGLTTCRRDLACLQKLRAETGATHLLDLEATFQPDRISHKHSYTVTVSLVDTASGIEVSNKSDRCPHKFCSVPQMTTAVVDLVSAAIADGRKAAAAAPLQAKAPAPPSVADPRPQPSTPVSPVVVSTQRDPRGQDSPPARRGRGFGWWVAGGGAAVAVAGGIVLSQNGKLGECADSKNDETCRKALNTKAPGVALLAVGGAALLVGGLDLLGLFGWGGARETAIVVGPSSVTFARSF